MMDRLLVTMGKGLPEYLGGLGPCAFKAVASPLARPEREAARGCCVERYFDSG